MIAGIGHLTFSRDEFQAQVPDFVPFDEDTTVVASGIAEISLGAALLLSKKHRETVGNVAAGFFTAVFTGNVSQYIHGRDGFGLDSDAKRLARLPLQPVLIALSIWSTRSR